MAGEDFTPSTIENKILREITNIYNKYVKCNYSLRWARNENIPKYTGCPG